MAQGRPFGQRIREHRNLFGQACIEVKGDVVTLWMASSMASWRSGCAANQGLAATPGRYALLLNSDARLLPGALAAMLDLARAQPRAAIVGARLLNPDGGFQFSHAGFPTAWREFLILSGLGRLVHGSWYPSHGPDEDRRPRQVDYVGGAGVSENGRYVKFGVLYRLSTCWRTLIDAGRDPRTVERDGARSR